MKLRQLRGPSELEQREALNYTCLDEVEPVSLDGVNWAFVPVACRPADLA